MKTLFTFIKKFAASLKPPFRLLLFGAPFVLILNACHECVGCEDYEVVRFNNFSASEVSSVIIKQYAPGSNFTNLTDSITVHPWTSDSVMYYTEMYFINADNQPSYNDVLIYVRADSLSYRVTNFAYTQTNCKRCPKIILYNLNSCYVNGVKDSTPLLDFQSYGGDISINK